MEKKERYRQLCIEEPSIPIFSRDWWLDAVCGEQNWRVAILENGGKIVGAMPYFIKKRMGFTLLTHPPLTQTLGPWIRPLEAKYSTVLGYQKDVMEALIEQLPRYDYFLQAWHYSHTNWQPFYWKGFEQRTAYTYVLDDLKDEKVLWDGIESKIRTDIKKATTRFNLKIRNDLGWEDFFEISRKSFDRQELHLPYSKDIVRRIDASCAKRNCRKIWIAEDNQGRRHGGIYIIWDENSAYYLMGGGDPELRNSGVTSLLLWTAIRHAGTVTKRFDFEGSMVEPIERFFRGFGAKQIPLFMISRIRSPFLQLHQGIVNMKRRKIC